MTTTGRNNPLERLLDHGQNSSAQQTEIEILLGLEPIHHASNPQGRSPPPPIAHQQPTGNAAAEYDDGGGGSNDGEFDEAAWAPSDDDGGEEDANTSRWATWSLADGAARPAASVDGGGDVATTLKLLRARLRRAEETRALERGEHAAEMEAALSAHAATKAELAAALARAAEDRDEAAQLRAWRDRELDARAKRRPGSAPPGIGYRCKICGQPGGLEKAHWVQDCPSAGTPRDPWYTGPTEGMEAAAAQVQVAQLVQAAQIVPEMHAAQAVAAARAQAEQAAAVEAAVAAEARERRLWVLHQPPHPSLNTDLVTKIYVGKLNRTTTTDQTLADYFEMFGPVVRAKVVYTHEGRSKGFGFVTFLAAAGRDAAMRCPFEHAIDGRRVRVAPAIENY